MICFELQPNTLMQSHFLIAKYQILHKMFISFYSVHFILFCSIFPKQLMIAVITCLYKAGDPHNIENYRSISILAAFSKILEKIVTVQVVEYFTNNNLFSSKQYAYRKGVSTSDAVLDIVNSLYDAFDVGETAVGVFLDLAKAFDSLNREILFRKLEYYGIGGN